MSVFEELQEVIPGGVNSPFRSFGQVGGTPPVLARGLGSRVWDVEGREYLDLLCAWGPLVLGHSHPLITRAVREALEDGTIFGAPTTWELELARLVRRCYPSMEKVRFVNSGAEAVASALRVARAATGRSRILKFEGNYHGHVECLDAAGEEADEIGGALALGASPALTAETLVARYNSLDSVREHELDRVAAVILEPVTGSMGVIAPDPGFLEGLRTLCLRHGCLLIFDEVLCGFRVALGGAQERYRVTPDLTCLGKALAGGLAVGAFGGRRELMDLLAPVGTVYQAGTFCGNPLTVRAALAALKAYSQPGFYARLESLTERLAGLRELGITYQAVGSLFSLGFGPPRLRDERDTAQLDRDRYARFFHGMLARGVYLPPSTGDAACVSAAHTLEEMDRVLEAASEVLAGKDSRT
ncbi:aminotransferase class III-fold pyridoxal phosphate-dependent enzyme [bacterium CPR1]|nr:aminotransferase class III-fold pyridoxal phosphate-dependent enzyme [bacterium CPR1]